MGSPQHYSRSGTASPAIDARGGVADCRTALQQAFHRHDCRVFAWKTASLAPILHTGTRVLDVGCGDGRLAGWLRRTSGCKVTGLDTIDYLMEPIPFRQFDGRSIPYDNNTFDVVLLVSVLHHAQHARALIREAARVGKRVAIIEDYCQTPIGKLGLVANDYFVNILQNSYKVWSGYRRRSVFQMDWRLHFRTVANLRELFVQEGLRECHHSVTPRSWKGMRHGTYLLEAV
jgi:ubiquinone/menaquinone biosynthesis C-methylase UbiE